MNHLINRLVSEVTAPIGDMSMRLFKMAMLFFLAISCLMAGAVFLTIGFFEFLEPMEGYTGAAISVGGLYLAAAIICIVVIARERPGRARQATAAEKEDEKTPEEKELQPSQKKALFTSNIDKAVSPILDILQEAGMEREGLAVQAGAEIAKKMNPYSLVVIALVAGVVLSGVNRGHPSRR